MIFKEIIHQIKQADWEEIPQEDLWEDGELSESEVVEKIREHVIYYENWTLIRRINNG